MDIRHKLVKPNALSQKHQLKVVYVGETKFQKEVWLTSRRDEFAKEMKQKTQKGIKSYFHLQNQLLWYKQNRFYVSEGKLRDVLFKECHDGPLVGHGGTKRTITFLKKTYYWPNLKDNGEEYLKTCLTCQQNRTVMTITNSWKAMQNCVHGFHGEFAAIKGIWYDHGGGGSI